MLRLVILLAIAASLAGCSFIGVTKARTLPDRSVVCEATYITPAIDTAFALASGSLLVWGLTAPSHAGVEDHALQGRDLAAVPGVIGLAVFGIAAAYGYSRVAQCKHDTTR